MGLSYNIFASLILASLLTTFTALLRKIIIQPIEELSWLALLPLFIISFIATLILLSYQDKKAEE
jgi:membrane protein DedA with SNARE-associated domain